MLERWSGFAVGRRKLGSKGTLLVHTFGGSEDAGKSLEFSVPSPFHVCAVGFSEGCCLY